MEHNERVFHLLLSNFAANVKAANQPSRLFSSAYFLPSLRVMIALFPACATQTHRDKHS
jgi:hypothetical protein